MALFELSTKPSVIPVGTAPERSSSRGPAKPSVLELSPASVQRERVNDHEDDSASRPTSRSPEGGSPRSSRRLSIQTGPLGFSPVRRIASSYRIRSSRSRKHDYAAVANDEVTADDSGDDDDHYLVEEDTWISQGSRPSRRRRRWLVCTSIGCGILLITLLILNALLFVSRSYRNEPDPDAIFGNWGQAGSGTEDRAWYPTDFLRDVVPVPCHSHNDYWRNVPLFSALHAGCIGVEADVFEVGGDSLLVGHKRAGLSPNRTLESLYIDPLVDLLTRANTPPMGTGPNQTRVPGTQAGPHGVFDMDPHQTLVLLIDFKTDGASTYDKVWDKLAPLRSRGWLTTYTEGGVGGVEGVVEGPVTVVASGSARFDVILRNAAPGTHGTNGTNGTRRRTQRDIFYDAPLVHLDDVDDAHAYNRTNSYYASVKLSQAVGPVWLGGGLRGAQRRQVRHQIREAHRRGLLARYWSLPSWPIHFRNRVWEQLLGEGLDMLNVDDVQGAAKRDWTKDAWL